MKLIGNTWEIHHSLPKPCAPYLLYTNVNSKWFDISFNCIIKLEDLRVHRFWNETTIDFISSLLSKKVIEWIN